MLRSAQNFDWGLELLLRLQTLNYDTLTQLVRKIGLSLLTENGKRTNYVTVNNYYTANSNPRHT